MPLPISSPSLTYLSISALVAVFTVTPRIYALSLDEYYGKAREQSELLRSTEIDRAIAISQRDQVLTTEKPRITFGADASYHVNKPDKEKWGNNKDAGIRTEFRQPLLDGGVSRASIRAGEAAIESSKWDYKAGEQGLYLQIASLFYGLITQKEDIINLEQSIKIYRQRVGDLSRRERIGRSREAEVLSARTQVELTNSMIAATRIAMGTEEEQLASLTGMAPPLKLDDSLNLGDLKAEALPEARAPIPSVEAAQARIEVAAAQIDLVRAGLNPRFDFIAAHSWRYLDPTDQGTHDLSLGLGFTWTLYDAGSINTEVNTASLQRKRAELAKVQADREGKLNLNLARRRFENGLQQIKTYQTALDIVERTIGAQQNEFESGLITNLELLTTLDQRLQIRRNLDQAIYRAKLDFVQSRVYSGNWPQDNQSGS